MYRTEKWFSAFLDKYICIKTILLDDFFIFVFHNFKYLLVLKLFKFFYILSLWILRVLKIRIKTTFEMNGNRDHHYRSLASVFELYWRGMTGRGPAQEAVLPELIVWIIVDNVSNKIIGNSVGEIDRRKYKSYRRQLFKILHIDMN